MWTNLAERATFNLTIARVYLEAVPLFLGLIQINATMAKPRDFKQFF